MKIEIPDTTFPHRVDVQMRFNDIDILGHVNNNAYMEYYDIGKEHFLKTVIQDDFTQQRIVPVVAHVEVDYLHPIVRGDQIEVLTTLQAVGKKSFTLYQQIRKKNEDTPLSQATTVMVCFDRENLQAVEVPQQMTSLLNDNPSSSSTL